MRRGSGDKAVQLSSQASLSGPISQLSPELIGAIISECYTSGEADRSMDKKTLFSTSYVSHLWRAESVRYLFSEITFTIHKSGNTESLKPFVKFLNRSPHLRSHIILLKLKQISYHGDTSTSPVLNDGGVARIMDLLPNLGSLDIEFSGIYIPIGDQATAVATSNRKLIIDHLSILQPGSPINATRYLSHFSKIKTLRIIDQYRTGKAPKFIAPLIIEVQSLELAISSSYLDTLRPILRPSYLTSLALYAVSGINTLSLKAFLDIHGVYLQSFKYVAHDAPGDISVLGTSCLLACTQLRTISLSLRACVPLTARATVEPLVSEWNACIDLIMNISAKLEHVTLTISVPDSVWYFAQGLKEVQEAVVSLPWTSIKDVIDKFPTLRQVEVVLVTTSDILEADDMAKIQDEVRSKLEEKTRKKVIICAGNYESLSAIFANYESDSDNFVE